ncbi:MAG: PLP-dependent aminotransferase family protein [Proteobacteria bacterium]|nr:PLP-dependent aminotransferase family protein [Pseudomonadota bacterium]
MPRTADKSPLLAIDLDKASATPMHRQIFDQIRRAILTGRLVPGRRLPSSRVLADELGVSRNTVLAAFDQLLAEGYTEGRIGSGTRVADALPEDYLAARAGRERAMSGDHARKPRLSNVGRALQTAVPKTRIDPNRWAFRPGVPEVARFPWAHWSRLCAGFWRRPPLELIAGGATAGFKPLRAAIADYLGAVRGLACQAEQVIVTAGAQQAIDLAARALLNPGDKVWIEEPGYAGIRGVLTAVNAEMVPIAVDDAGIDVDAGIAIAPDARMAIVTPSHQYPLGSVMSLARRLALLEWARQTDAWILEDDYDSEYRYGGRPISALQGLDRDGRVIYCGTFSKVMFPTIRIGYLVVPLELVEPLAAVRSLIDDQTAIALQPVLAAFIESGHFAQHIRRMRTLYAERQDVILDALKSELSGALDVTPDESGMHLVAEIRPSASIWDADVAELAAARGLSISPLSRFFLGRPNRNGLLLGYAGIEARDIRTGVKKLARIFDDLD